MPTRAEHLVKAAGNEEFAAALPLETSSQIEWAIVVRFYAAVHYIEAYLAIAGIHSSSHADRNGHINRLARIKSLWADYRRLKDYAQDARYGVRRFTIGDVANAGQRLVKIREHIKGLL